MNILNFGGRARRAEFWWFFLWQILAGGAIGGVIGYFVVTNPDFLSSLQQTQEAQRFGATPTPALPPEIWEYYGYYFAANLVLFWLPGLAVTWRRLHDTDRSGLWYFISLVPIIGFIWLIVLLCLPGTHGNNRFGPDSAPDRKRPAPSHPAFAAPLDGDAQAEAESARRAAARDYYRKHVLPSIQRAEPQA